MSKIAFNFNKYLVIISNHGWYEIHDRELRERIVKNDIAVHEIRGETKAGGLIVKKDYVPDSLLYTGKIQKGTVDAESSANLKWWAYKRLFNFLTSKEIKSSLNSK